MDFRQASHPTTPMHHFINLAQGKRLQRNLQLIFPCFDSFYFILFKTPTKNYQTTHKTGCGEEGQTCFVLAMCFHLRFPCEEMMAVGSSTHVVTLHIMSHAGSSSTGAPQLLFEAALPACQCQAKVFFPTPSP